MAETIKEPLYGGEKEIFDRIEYDAHYIRDLLDQEEYTDVLAQKENLPTGNVGGYWPSACSGLFLSFAWLKYFR